MKCVRCSLLAYLKPSQCKAWLIEYNLPVYQQKYDHRIGHLGFYGRKQLLCSKSNDEANDGCYNGNNTMPDSVDRYPTSATENDSNHINCNHGRCDNDGVDVPVYIACSVNSEDLFHNNVDSQSFEQTEEDVVAQMQLELILSDSTVTFEALKRFLIGMLTDLGEYHMLMRILTITNDLDFRLCFCGDFHPMMIDVRPGLKEVSKQLSQYSTNMFEYLHKLDWNGFRSYIRKLEVCNRDPDVKTLIAIYRIEEMHGYRSGKDTLKQCKIVEDMLPFTVCHGYLAVRLLSTMAAGCLLSRESKKTIEYYHQGAQIAIGLEPNMASAYCIASYAIHGLLHRQNGNEIMLLPADDTAWDHAELYLRIALEQHSRWVDTLKEDAHIPMETITVFFSWTLLKYALVLVRSCAIGHYGLLQLNGVSLENLKRARHCLNVLVKDLKMFSIRAAVGVNLLACDLCIRFGQLSQSEGAVRWYKEAHRNAFRAKLISGQMSDKRHANIGYDFTSRRLKFILTKLKSMSVMMTYSEGVHNCQRVDESARLNDSDCDGESSRLDEAIRVDVSDPVGDSGCLGDSKCLDEFQLTLPILKQTSIGYIDDSLIPDVGISQAEHSRDPGSDSDTSTLLKHRNFTHKETSNHVGVQTPEARTLLTYPKSPMESTFRFRQSDLHLTEFEDDQTTVKHREIEQNGSDGSSEICEYHVERHDSCSEIVQDANDKQGVSCAERPDTVVKQSS